MTSDDAKRYLDNYDLIDKAKIIRLMKLYCKDRQTIRWVKAYNNRIKKYEVRCACGKSFSVENMLYHESSLIHLRIMLGMKK
jgi:hypothetical protein